MSSLLSPPSPPPIIQSTGPALPTPEEIAAEKKKKRQATIGQFKAARSTMLTGAAGEGAGGRTTLGF